METGRQVIKIDVDGGSLVVFAKRRLPTFLTPCSNNNLDVLIHVVRLTVMLASCTSLTEGGPYLIAHEAAQVSGKTMSIIDCCCHSNREKSKAQTTDKVQRGASKLGLFLRQEEGLSTNYQR